jgi:hypothetical protein
VPVDRGVEGGLAAGHPVQGLLDLGRARYLPAQPMIDAVTRALEPGATIPGRDLAVLAAWAAGCLLLSVRFFQWDPHRPRHAGIGGGKPTRSV